MEQIRRCTLICAWIVFCVLSLYGFGLLMENKKFEVFEFQAICSFCLVLFCFLIPRIVLWGLLWIWGMTFSVIVFFGTPIYFLENQLPGIFKYYDEVPFFAQTSLVFGFVIYFMLFWGLIGGFCSICFKFFKNRH
jgi:hypothetical protein